MAEFKADMAVFKAAMAEFKADMKEGLKAVNQRLDRLFLTLVTVLVAFLGTVVASLFVG